MTNCAVIDDESSERALLITHLSAFSNEFNVQFSYSEYSNAISFLTDLQNGSQHDIVFLDIDMPHMDGISAARKLREGNSVTPIIFITNMAQYALKGYAVNATDFMLKPVAYRDLCQTMHRALDCVRRIPKQAVRLKTATGVLYLYPSQIYYVEIANHRIVYHTEKGNVQGYGTMKKVIEELPFPCFASCHTSYYVNMQYVTEVQNLAVVVHGEALPISRPKKAAFMRALNIHYGGI